MWPITRSRLPAGSPTSETVTTLSLVVRISSLDGTTVSALAVEVGSFLETATAVAALATGTAVLTVVSCTVHVRCTGSAIWFTCPTTLLTIGSISCSSC